VAPHRGGGSEYTGFVLGSDDADANSTVGHVQPSSCARIMCGRPLETGGLAMDRGRDYTAEPGVVYLSNVSTSTGSGAVSSTEPANLGRLAASLMCADFAALPSQLEALERGGIRCAHLDFGDGRFVRNLPLGVEIFAQLPARGDWSRECHLMLAEPLAVIHLFAPYSDLIFFHVEAASDPVACIEAIRAAGARPGIAINPATAAESIVDLLPAVEDVLVMAVEPGFAGSPFIPEVVEKVGHIRALADAASPGIRIEVDGAVGPGTIPSLVDAGADRFVGGTTGLFTGGDLEANARSLIACIEQAGDDREAGPPARPAAQPAAVAIGMDIGATRLKLALVASDGSVLDSMVLPTPRDGTGQETIDQIADAVLAFRDDVAGAARVRGFGISVPNFVAGPQWVQRWANNLPDLEGVAMRPLLEARLGGSIAMANDVSAAATAEHMFGRGRGRDRLLLMSIGTGISIGVIVEGELLQYFLGTVGDTGHIIVDPEGRIECTCGARGCLETLASGTGIRNEAIRAVRSGEPTVLAALVEGGSRLTAEAVAGAAREGDAVAKRIFERASFFLGVALTTYVHMFAPELIVFAGGVTGSMDLLQAGIRDTVERFSNPSLLSGLEGMELSAFPDLGAAIGSAGLILFPGRYLRSSYRWRSVAEDISHA
jgi:glucokinase